MIFNGRTGAEDFSKCPCCDISAQSGAKFHILSEEEARKIRPEFYNKDALWDLCNKFVKDNDISCPEAINQCEWISENSLDLIEDICKIVGYNKEK